MKKTKKLPYLTKASNYNRHLFILVSLLIIIIGIFLFQRNKYTSSAPSTNSVIREKAQPQLKSNYTVTVLNTDWDTLESQDFNFSIHIPKNTTIQKGGSFDGNPDTETAQLSFELPANLANVGIAVDTGKKLSKSIYEMAENQSKNTGGGDGPHLIYTQPTPKTINGVQGYEIYASDNIRTHVYNFFTESGDRYIILSYSYPFNGITLTDHEASLVNEIIASFKLLK